MLTLTLTLTLSQKGGVRWAWHSLSTASQTASQKNSLTVMLSP